jgi:hypothetical protein
MPSISWILRGARWAILLLPGVGLIEWGAHEYFRRSAPSEQDWAALEPAIRALYRSGDAVAIAPKWGEPLLRHHLGDPFFPLDVVARADDDDLARVILVSFLGQSTNEYWRWNVAETRASGPFTITVYSNPNPERPKLRFIDRIHPPYLEVFDGPDGDPKPCAYLRNAPVLTGGLGGEPTFPRERFVCGMGAPHFVAVTTIDDERFRPRRCIWAHPTPNGPLTLVFHQVPIGQRLVGHAGLPWLLSRDGSGTPIEITATVDGERVGRHVVVDQDGFTRFEWSTALQRDRVADLELRITTEQARNRRLCFTLESR